MHPYQQTIGYIFEDLVLGHYAVALIYVLIFLLIFNNLYYHCFMVGSKLSNVCTLGAVENGF